jgi:CRISPR type I-E-associated protein CasB/Cse2
LNESTREQYFIKRLEALPSGERAELKRACGQHLNESDAKAFGIFYKVLPQGVPPWQEDRWFCTACLSCLWRPSDEEGKPMEECLAVLKEKGSQSFENRIVAMLDGEWTADGRLGLKLFRMAKLIRQKGMKVNTAALLADLCNWDRVSRKVQKRWARAICKAPETETQNDKPQKEE